MRLYLNFTSQEQIDAEYDLESVLDMAMYGDWLMASAEKTRAEATYHPKVAYGPTLDEYVDVFPSDTPDSPVLVFIHGGWWRAMESSDFHMVARGPRALGMTVVMVNYSLCPKVSISEITRQNRAALAWTYRHISQFNGDPEKIFVAGHSAGGHQVGMMTLTNWEEEYGLPKTLIRGGIPISGLFDLRPFRYSWLQPKLLLTYEVIERESPLFHVTDRDHLPPLMITLGGEESSEFHRQSDSFASAWTAAGGDATRFEQPGRDHISAITDLENPSSEFSRAVDTFVRQHSI